MRLFRGCLAVVTGNGDVDAIGNDHVFQAVDAVDRCIGDWEMEQLPPKSRQSPGNHAPASAWSAGEEYPHRLAVGLIAAETFQAVIHLLNFHLRDDFSVPHVALRLWDKPAGIEDLPEFAGVSEELQVFAETLARPYCGSTAGFGTASWFGEHAPHIRSQALIALRNGGGTIGLVALGSEEGQRFYTDMGTLYLERIGEMVSAALARVTRSTL